MMLLPEQIDEALLDRYERLSDNEREAVDYWAADFTARVKASRTSRQPFGVGTARIIVLRRLAGIVPNLKDAKMDFDDWFVGVFPSPTLEKA